MSGKFAINHQAKKGKCRVSENGKVCRQAMVWRGLCKLHYQRINLQGKLNEFALPRMARIFNEDDFEVVKTPLEGCCQMKEKGELCQEEIHCRGLCKQHYDIIRSHKLIETYGLASKILADYKLNPEPKENACRILENGKPCTKKVFGRGMCRKHRIYFYRRKQLEEFGTPSRSGCYFEGTPRGKEKKY